MHKFEAPRTPQQKYGQSLKHLLAYQKLIISPQGVIIPALNISGLMLRKDVVKTISEGKKMKRRKNLGILQKIERI